MLGYQDKSKHSQFEILKELYEIPIFYNHINSLRDRIYTHLCATHLCDVQSNNLYKDLIEQFLIIGYIFVEFKNNEIINNLNPTNAVYLSKSSIEIKKTPKNDKSIFNWGTVYKDKILINDEFEFIGYLTDKEYYYYDKICFNAEFSYLSSFIKYMNYDNILNSYTNSSYSNKTIEMISYYENEGFTDLKNKIIDRFNKLIRNKNIEAQHMLCFKKSFIIM
jgi:hypothetical protein